MITFSKKWQNSWDEEYNNKLHSIQSNLSVPWNKCYRDDRREEVVLTRCRIGHTHLTHCYLLKGEDMPQCIPCAAPLTVKHILIECVDFDIVRSRYYVADSMEDLFRSVDPTMILRFLKDIGLFFKL